MAAAEPIYEAFAKDNIVLVGSPIMNTGSEADDSNTLRKDHVVSASKKWQLRMIQFINEGIGTGELKENIDASQMAFTISSLIEEGLLLARISQDQSTMDQILYAVDQVILASTY